jgi:Spy/CpxP family protein refolding chaperone
MSYISSVASSSLFATTTTQTTSNSLRPFADLNLTEEQRTQIRSIFQQAQSQGLSQTQIQQQINAVLTPAQQSTLQNDIAQHQTPPPPQDAANGTPPQGQPPSGADALSNLSLTDTQKTQIDQILQQAQAGTITQAQALTQITNLLTPTQQTALQQDEQTAQTRISGHHHHGGGSASTSSSSSSSSSTSTAVATLPSGVTETDIQNQVAAATSVILNQLQSDVAGS